MDMLPGLHEKATLTAPYQRRYLAEAQAQLHGSTPLLVFDNHDNARSIDRFGDGVHDVAIAKLVAALLYTTRAAALTYYGAEIGMRTTPPTRREDVKDPIGISGWPVQKGRDGERTPMQWTPGAQAGFSTNPHTWLPIPPSHREVNVETERADPDSLFNWTRRLIALRRSNAALASGAMRMLGADDAQLLIYARTAAASHQTVIVALNMSDQPRLVHLEVGQSDVAAARPIAAVRARTLLTTDPSLQGEVALADLELAPYAVWIAAVRG
jgi:alpha-glucosidase